MSRKMGSGKGTLSYKSGKWRLRICVDGKQRMVTLGPGTEEWAKAEAEKTAILHQSSTIAGESGLVAVAQRIVNDAAAGDAGKLKLSELWNKYPYDRPARRQTAKPIDGKELARRKTYWTEFASAMESSGVTTLGTLTTAKVDAYFRQLRSHLSASTVHYRHTVATVILRNAGWTGTTKPAPIHYARDVSSHRPLLPDHVAIIRARPVMDDLDLLIHILLNTGLRIGDAVRIEWRHLHDGMIVGLVQQKDGSPVMIPMTTALSEITAALPLPHDGTLFRHTHTLTSDGRRRVCKPLPTWHATSHTHAVTARLKHITGGDYTAHDLRTTFASRAAESGVPMQVISQWMGHDSLTVTRIYAQLSAKATKAWMAKINL